MTLHHQLLAAVAAVAVLGAAGPVLAGDADGAAQAFEAALRHDAADADALGGLGLIRMRQGRAPEARDLLARASAGGPEAARRWEGALDRAASAVELAQARRQLAQGGLDGAEALLLRAARRGTPDRAEAEVLLGNIALHHGEAAEAEAHFRAAAARRPALPTARDGLLESLRRQSRIAEAEALIRLTVDPSSPRSDALRAEAARTEDPEAALALLRHAVTAAPASAWARLDLARLLARQGHGAEAMALLAEMPAAVPGPDMAQAVALLAEEEGCPADGIRALERVPDRLRGVDQARLLRSLRWQAELAAAPPARRRAALLVLAGRPDPTGEAGLRAVRALARAGDGEGATEAARLALAMARAAPSVRVLLAGALADAGLPGEAADLLRPLAAEADLPAALRRQVSALLPPTAPSAPGLAVVEPSLSVAMEPSRSSRDATELRAAARIAQAVLNRDPRNAEARIAAIEAALALWDLPAAERMLDEGRRLNASDPRVSVAEAQLARSRGDRRRAQSALQLAADQRRAQIAGGDTIQATPYRRTALAGGGQGTPAPQASSPASALQQEVTPGQLRASEDPLLSEIGRQLAEVNNEASGRVVPNFEFRARSGQRGLERLREYGGGAEAAVPISGVGGELSARVQAVTIDAGRHGASATGTSLGGAYTRNTLAVDLGSTPLGFREQTLLGGIELTPRIGETLQLRLRGERRSVTDSLLSWSGMRDPATGQSFGGVVRNTGRAQLEYLSGATGAYVGGGYSGIDGHNVASNRRWEAGAGINHALLRTPAEELVTGLDLVYYGYERNLRPFTLGHGGYFSPQTYGSASIPLDYRARQGNWAYRLGGSLGIAHFAEKRSPYFPADGALQAVLETRAAADPSVSAFYPSQRSTAVTAGGRADIEYALTPSLRIGATARYDRSADFDETRALLYARYRFDP